MKKLINGTEYMVIEVYYDRGGINYFTDKTEERGYYIDFEHAFITDGWKESIPRLEHNFKIFVKEAKRYSKKQEEKLELFLEKNKDKLFDMYSKLEKSKIYDFLKENIKE